MEYIILGAVGAMLVLVPFLLGVVIGMKTLGKKQQGSAPAPLTQDEAEKQRFMEDQRAFESLLQYNTDVVYGRTGNLGGEDT